MSSEVLDSDSSDIEMQSALPKMPLKKLPNSPSDDLLKKKQDKKFTMKIMIQQALTDLKSRKGVSVYAIKKHISEKHNVDTKKLKYRIKKSIKSAVEEGIIIQTKGIGATGSFKLAPIKEKKPKTQKPKKVENTEKTKDPENKKKIEEKSKKPEEKSLKPKVKSKESNEDKPVKPKKMTVNEKNPTVKKNAGEKAKRGRIGEDLQSPSKKAKIPKDTHTPPKKVRIVKDVQSPSKKGKITKDTHTPSKKMRIGKDMQISSKRKAMIKRKSIGSIIKPPKMKPKAKA